MSINVKASHPPGVLSVPIWNKDEQSDEKEKSGGIKVWSGGAPLCPKNEHGILKKVKQLATFMDGTSCHILTVQVKKKNEACVLVRCWAESILQKTGTGVNKNVLKVVRRAWVAERTWKKIEWRSPLSLGTDSKQRVLKRWMEQQKTKFEYF